MSGESVPARPHRRHVAFGLAALLAACGGKDGKSGSGRFDPKVLDKGFPDLADRARPGVLNAAVLDLSNNASWFWNIDKPFPLAGAAIVPMAAAVLAEVDRGLIRLTDHVTIRDVDLSPPYSLIAEQWLNRPENLKVGDLMTLAVQYGDNTAADVLMNVVGGPGAVTAWLRGHGVGVMRIDRYAREIGVQVCGLPSFRPAWRTSAAFGAARSEVPVADRQAAMNAYLDDPRDTTSAQDAITFLTHLARGDLMSAPFADYLVKLMATAGGGQVGAGLGKGGTFAHHAGAAATDLGFTPAVADMGIVNLKDGRRFAACAFLAGSTASQAQRDALFNGIGRLIGQATGAG